MSDTKPGECRSIGCEERAVYFAALAKKWRRGDGRRAPADKWQGEFCALHLDRVFEFKISEMNYGDVLTIERIFWST